MICTLPISKNIKSGIIWRKRKGLRILKVAPRISKNRWTGLRSLATLIYKYTNLQGQACISFPLNLRPSIKSKVWWEKETSFINFGGVIIYQVKHRARRIRQALMVPKFLLHIFLHDFSYLFLQFWIIEHNIPMGLWIRSLF